MTKTEKGFKNRTPKKRVQLIIILSILFIVFLALSLLNYYSRLQVNTKTINGYFHAHGNVLHDINDNEIQLRGTNIGGWLVPEGWMTQLYIEGQDDGKIGEKLTYLKLINALSKNSSIGSIDKAETVYATYIDNWFREDDVKRIKGLGLNCIRLPFVGLIYTPLTEISNPMPFVIWIYA